MQFLLILALLIAFAVPSADTTPLSSVAYRVGAAAAGLALLLLLATTATRLTAAKLHRNFAQRTAILRRYQWFRWFHAGLLMGVFAITIHVLGWGHLVRNNWGLGGTILLDELLVLAPFLASLVFCWAIFYGVDRAMRELTAESQDATPRVRSRMQYVGFQVRHNLALLLIPILILFAAQDAIRLWAPSEAGPSGVQQLALLGVIGLVMLGFPLLLRWIWQAHPLPEGPLRDRLVRAAGRQRFRVRNILRWNTQGAVVNAAVVGFVPRLRYVLLSDGLLDNMADSEIEAVFGHEAGHIVHRHLFSRLLCLAAVIALVMVLSDLVPQWLGGVAAPLGTLDLSPMVPAGLLIAAVAAMTFWLVFGYCSRKLERQADVYGCRSNSCGNAECQGDHELARSPATAAQLPEVICPTSIEMFISSLEKLAVLNGISRSAASWQHSSIARRVDFLKKMHVDPQVEQRFQRSVKRLNWLLLSVLCGVLGAHFLL